MSGARRAPALAAALLLLVAAALASPPASAAATLQCAQVAQLMAPCTPYLTGAPGMTPYGVCCNSLAVLSQLAAARADRVAACACAKAAAAAGLPAAVDFARAAGLPAACGLSISFTISPDMDCNQVTEEP
uniref:Non-specific lipid-transfer protein n=1 Tax=Zea mays TaxID=4577 RepID=B6TLQ7_MAIZE|nr:nonspecific lipid-transfer protein precursor [Zea mays]